jgi:hypothetical protein
MTENLRKLFGGLQERLSVQLRTAASAVQHPVAKGDSCEFNWKSLLEGILPYRYQANGAFVIDSRGTLSDQIDIVIHDRQYTPVFFNQDGIRVIPAESVYGVFEVKTTFDEGNILYAGQKAASARRLARTSAPIIHAGGTFEPRSPVPILAGILASRTGWSPPLGAALRNCLSDLGPDERIDLGCAADSGSFEATYGDRGLVTLATCAADKALVYFLLKLLHRLQVVGTVTAIDYSSYAKVLEDA